MQAFLFMSGRSGAGSGAIGSRGRRPGGRGEIWRGVSPPANSAAIRRHSVRVSGVPLTWTDRLGSGALRHLELPGRGAGRGAGRDVGLEWRVISRAGMLRFCRMAEGARGAPWRKGLLKLALTVALTVQSPALAGHNYLTEVPGLAVIEDQVIRPDGGSARLLIARIDPGRMLARVVHAGSDSRHLPGLDGRKASGDGTLAPHGDDGSPAWRVLINASYFDENEKSLMLLRDRSREFTGFRKGRGAVFSCTEGRCSIQHARDFDPAAEYDIAVQSTPWVLASTRATEGVKNPREVDPGQGWLSRRTARFSPSRPSPSSGEGFPSIRCVTTSPAPTRPGISCSTAARPPR